MKLSHLVEAGLGSRAHVYLMPRDPKFRDCFIRVGRAIRCDLDRLEEALRGGGSSEPLRTRRARRAPATARAAR